MQEEPKVEIFSVNYPDRDAARLIYRELCRSGREAGIYAQALDKYLTSSRRAKSRFRIILVTGLDKGINLPSTLRCMQERLVDHPLYKYLCFDNVIKPLSQISWDCGSYDEPTYQKIFIKKRERG